MDNTYYAVSARYARAVHWDRLFEDLEGQLASEWEAERAALDAEAERLRVARIELRTRLETLAARQRPITVQLLCGEAHNLTVKEVGADWLAAQETNRRALIIVPLAAIVGVTLDRESLLESLEERDEVSALRRRMTLGFVLRDLARRRMPVTLATADAVTLHGTIDRAGADHLDLALHDAGEPRRSAAVRGLRMVPLAALCRLSLGGEYRAMS